MDHYQGMSDSRMLARLEAARSLMEEMSSSEIFKHIQDLASPLKDIDFELRCKIMDAVIEYGFRMKVGK